MKKSERKLMAKELLGLAKRLTAGTWALPKNSSDVVRIVQYVRMFKQGEWPTKSRLNPICEIMQNLIGNDALHDQLDNMGEQYLRMCADAIVKHVNQLAKQPEDSFKDNKEYQALQVLRDSLS